MKKKHSKIDKVLLLLIIIFSIFGIIMVFSASSLESYMRFEKSPYYYLIRHLFFVGVGLFIYFLMHIIPVKVYKKLSTFAIIAITIVMITLLVLGKATRNAVSWIQLGPIRLQPSEFAKIFVIIFLGSYYEKKRDVLDSQWNIIKPLLIVVVIAILIALQPDLGTAMILAIVTIIIFYSVPIKKEYRSIFNKIFVGALAIIIVLLISTKGSILRDYQKDRLTAFLHNPCENYQQKEGYQLCNSYIAFHNGGLTGKGIGESTQKYLYLPDSYTDFIFPIIVEEWGLLVGILIIIGYGIILYRIFTIARHAKNLGNGLIAYGVFIYIFTHITINLIGVMGLAPLTGVPLPFLSYGGSYTLSLFIALGLVQRISVENNLN